LNIIIHGKIIENYSKSLLIKKRNIILMHYKSNIKEFKKKHLLIFTKQVKQLFGI